MNHDGINNNSGDMNDDQLHGLFQEMRDEAVPADSLARVRAGVAQRIESRRASPWRWGSLAALIAVGVFVAVMVWPRLEAPARPEPIVPLEVKDAPGQQPPAAAPKPNPRVISHAQPKLRSSQARPGQRLVTEPRPRVVTTAAPKPRPVKPALLPDVAIRIQTDDPEVVILLVN